MVRNVNAVTQSMNDVNVYKCDSCGAGLSLLNGGKCDYCGNGLDLKKYDWVITDFSLRILETPSPYTTFESASFKRCEMYTKNKNRNGKN